MAPLERQVIIKGEIEKISSVDSDNYFSSRPKGSQISALVSEQSKAIRSREILEKKMDLMKQNILQKKSSDLKTGEDILLSLNLLNFGKEGLIDCMTEYYVLWLKILGKLKDYLHKMKRLVLLRHAKSSWDLNVSDKDRPLTEKGINRITMISVNSSNILSGADLIFSSPANRALHTACIMMNSLGLSFTKIVLKRNFIHLNYRNYLISFIIFQMIIIQ